MRRLYLACIVYLLYLALSRKIEAKQTDDQNGGLRLLVRKTDHSFLMVSLATNQSIDLWNQRGTPISLTSRPSGDEAFFIMKNSTDRYITKRASGEVELLHFDLPLRDCWVHFKKEKSDIENIELDFISENMYISTTCGEIYACNLHSLKCSEIYTLGARSRIDLVVYPEKGLLFWAEHLKERTAEGKELTIKGSSSIFRANLDGSSVSLVTNGFTDLHYFVLDREHGRIYMERKDMDELYTFGILEGHKPIIVPAFTSHFLAGKYLKHVSGDIFIWLSTKMSQVILIDATKEVGNQSVLYQSSTEDSDVEILPQEVAEDHRRSNPCLTRNCSHFCALSGPEGASCLCGRKEGLSLDQVTCTERFLVVSALDGMYRLGLDDQSAVEYWDLLNISKPELVAHDPVNGGLFWIEQDIGEEAAQIYRLEVASGKRALALEVKFNTSRAGPQAIQAMDVDWMTRNIYFAVQHEARIRVCGYDSNVCTEILGNFVSGTFCDLELLPKIGKLLWVDVFADGDSVETMYLNIAGMDGADAEYIASYKDIRLTNCPCMAVDHANLSIYMTFTESSGVNRVDMFDLEGNKYRSAYLGNRKYIPNHMYASEGDLIWVGRPSGSTGESTNDVIFKARMGYDGINFIFEDYASWNMTHVTDITHYGFYPKWINSSLRERARQNEQCRGVLLLSENGTLRCSCPRGTRTAADGLSCKKPEHIIIYGTEEGHVFLKNDSGASPISLASSVFAYAYADKENQLLWANSSGNFYEGLLSVTNSATFVSFKEVAQNLLFSPRQIEYDWVGDNIFSLEGNGNIWACGRTFGACVMVVTQRERLNGEVRFALDPKRGFIYWIVEGGKAIFRTNMDGTGNTSSQLFRSIVHAMAVDQNDGLLYFAGNGNSYRVGQSHLIPDNRILYFRFAKNSYNYLAVLSDMPKELKATDGYVFWTSWSASTNKWSIFSCEKDSGNGLEVHVSAAIVPWGRIAHFDLTSQNPEHSKLCHDRLCSHICIPTVTGYMRCACPIARLFNSCEFSYATHGV